MASRGSGGQRGAPCFGIFRSIPYSTRSYGCVVAHALNKRCLIHQAIIAPPPWSLSSQPLVSAEPSLPRRGANAKPWRRLEGERMANRYGVVADDHPALRLTSPRAMSPPNASQQPNVERKGLQPVTHVTPALLSGAPAETAIKHSGQFAPHRHRACGTIWRLVRFSARAMSASVSTGAVIGILPRAADNRCLWPRSIALASYSDTPIRHGTWPKRGRPRELHERWLTDRPTTSDN